MHSFFILLLLLFFLVSGAVAILLRGKRKPLFNWKQLCLNYVLCTGSDGSSSAASFLINVGANSLHESTSVLRELFHLDTPCGAAKDDSRENRSTEIDTQGWTQARHPLRLFGFSVAHSCGCQRALTHAPNCISKFEKFGVLKNVFKKRI